jgi:predicted nuclease with TOPRIM domain
MDKELLENLSKLFDEKLKPIQDDIKDMKSSQSRIEKKLDAVVEQTADLTEFRTETRDKLDNIVTEVTAIRRDLTNVEIITSSNWTDIAKLKAVK